MGRRGRQKGIVPKAARVVRAAAREVVAENSGEAEMLARATHGVALTWDAAQDELPITFAPFFVTASYAAPHLAVKMGLQPTPETVNRITFFLLALWVEQVEAVTREQFDAWSAAHPE